MLAFHINGIENMHFMGQYRDQIFIVFPVFSPVLYKYSPLGKTIYEGKKEECPGGTQKERRGRKGEVSGSL